MLSNLTQEEAIGQHVYYAVVCKDCKRRDVNTVLALKYIGRNDGQMVYAVPQSPSLLSFGMFCDSCGQTCHYSHNDVKVISSQQGPPADFVDKF